MKINQGGFEFDSHFHFDTAFALKRFFSDDRMLQTKIRVNEEYRTNPLTIVDHTVACLALTGDEQVLDMGCGVGYTLAGIVKGLTGGRAHGFDISASLLESARERLEREGLSAKLEVRDASFLHDMPSKAYDRIVANFMIHYVRDLRLTLREVARMLKPGGRFILTTDSTATMSEMYRVHFEAMRELGFPERLFRASPKARVCLENGQDHLAPVFHNVDLVRYEDALEFKTTAPFMEFYTIGHKFCCANAEISSDVTEEMFRSLAAKVEAKVQAIIDAEGSFLVRKRAGTFVCSNPR